MFNYGNERLRTHTDQRLREGLQLPDYFELECELFSRSTENLSREPESCAQNKNKSGLPCRC